MQYEKRISFRHIEQISLTATTEIWFLDVLFESLDITPLFSSVSHLECRYKSLNYHITRDKVFEYLIVKRSQPCMVP